MRGLLVRFVIASDTRYLPVVRGTIGALTAAIGWDESECRAIVLALDEAVANVIRHAYHSRSDGVIELECRQNADGLEVARIRERLLIADRIILIDRGNIAAMGPVEEIKNSQHPRVRQFLDRIADSTQDDKVDHLRMFTEGIR